MATPVEKWVEEQARLAKPDRIHWCDGSDEEARKLIEIGMKQEKIGDNPIFQELNHETWPNSYLHRSHPTDVARTEQLTFVCHPTKDQAGPNNNWMAPAEAKEKTGQAHRRLHEGQDHVRAALHDGAPGFAVRQEPACRSPTCPTSP